MKHLLKFEAKIVAITIVMFGIVNISCDKEDDVKQEVEQGNQQEPTKPQQDTVAENKKEQIEVKDSTIINKQDSVENEKQKQDSVLNTIERQKSLFKDIIEKDYTLKVFFYYRYHDNAGIKIGDKDSLIISNNIHLSLNEEETEIILYEDSLFNWKFTNIKFNDNGFNFDVNEYAKNYNDYINKKANKQSCIYNNNECKFKLYIQPIRALLWNVDYDKNGTPIQQNEFLYHNTLSIMMNEYFKDIKEKNKDCKEVSIFYYDGKHYLELVLEEN